MEATMYDDNSRSTASKLKLGMSLDLAPSEQERKLSKLTRINEMLGTPDLGLFMLASPDLERFIIQQNVQQNGLVLTTPTPTTQILFPKSVTEEQEAYARGFVDALGELHRKQGAAAVIEPQGGSVGQSHGAARGAAARHGGAVAAAAGGSFYQGGQRNATFASSTTTTTTLLPGSIFTASQPPAAATAVRVSGVSSIAQQSRANTYTPLVQPKIEGAQTVPTFIGGATVAPPATTPLPAPINMDDQELAKLDRKRARNRLAATRCRNRKLERIARLEERVSELKNQNGSLAEAAAALRDQVNQLKQSIIEHTRSGCQVMLSHNLL